MNKSKKDSPVAWKKWRASGAVGQTNSQRLVDSRPSSRAQFPYPAIRTFQSDVLERVHGIVMIHFREHGEYLAGLRNTIDELNGDEGDFIAIVGEIESQFGIRINIEDLQKQVPRDKPCHFQFLTSEIMGEYVYKQLLS